MTRTRINWVETANVTLSVLFWAFIGLVGCAITGAGVGLGYVAAKRVVQLLGS